MVRGSPSVRGSPLLSASYEMISKGRTKGGPLLAHEEFRRAVNFWARLPACRLHRLNKVILDMAQYQHQNIAATTNHFLPHTLPVTVISRDAT